MPINQVLTNKSESIVLATQELSKEILKYLAELNSRMLDSPTLFQYCPNKTWSWHSGKEGRGERTEQSVFTAQVKLETITVICTAEKEDEHWSPLNWLTNKMVILPYLQPNL